MNKYKIDEKCIQELSVNFQQDAFGYSLTFIQFESLFKRWPKSYQIKTITEDIMYIALVVLWLSS